MEKILLPLLSAFLFSSVLFAQNGEDTIEAKVWETGGQIQININQLALVNWAAGGENNIAGILLSSFFANYNKNNHSWENKLDLTYGTIYTKINGNRKSDDRIDLSSKYGYEFAEHWFASTLFNFRTQVFYGYNFFEDGTRDLVSRSMAPGYITIGAGIEYKPSDIFTVYLSPATGKFTIVREDEDISEEDFGLEPGETIKSEFGALLRAAVKAEVITNVELNSELQLFCAYEPNIDVDWKTMINLKVNKFITATLLLHLIYDHDVRIGLVNDDGGPVLIEDPDNPGTFIQKKGIRTQFKEAFGVGFSYNF